jgi:ribosome biogenesis GTPase A
MAIQWYPGHMTKAVRQIQEDLKIIDLIIELIDARIPYSSRNPDIRKLGARKARLVIVNKSDLADERANQRWMEAFQEEGAQVLIGDSRKKSGLANIHSVIREACKERIERNIRRGFKNRPIRAMIVGIPNVGKSTFINTMAGKASAKTGNKPGVTKGKQWIHLGKNLDLLDTPGILWPKFEDQSVGEALALTGSINQDIFEHVELSLKLIEFLERKYAGVLNEKYGIETTDDKVGILEEIAQKRNCLARGNQLSLDKAADILLDEFRSGKLGRITLEWPEDRS